VEIVQPGASCAVGFIGTGEPLPETTAASLLRAAARFERARARMRRHLPRLHRDLRPLLLEEIRAAETAAAEARRWAGELLRGVTQ
jgi:hypothetical protein